MKQKFSAYQKFVAYLGILFFVVPCVIVSFNYQVDPNRRYRFSVPEAELKKLAVSQDQVLVLPPNYNDRALLKKFVPNAVSPEVVVIGGSRAGNVQPEFFKRPWQTQFLNLAVTEGTVRDYVALWELIEQSGYKPKIVFICVEEQSINYTSQNNKYLSLYEYYTSFFNEAFSLRGQLLEWTTDLKDLLSIETTIASIKILFHPELVGGTGKVVPRTEYHQNQTTRTRSFSTILPVHTQTQDPDVILSLAQANGVGETKVFEKWNSKDQFGYDHLKELIRRIKRNGGIPVLVGMPYHPAAYEVIHQHPGAFQNLLIFVNELKNLADREEIFFYDAIQTHHADFEPQDFFDGVHLRTKSNFRLFQAIGHALNKSQVIDNKGDKLEIIAGSYDG